MSAPRPCCHCYDGCIGGTFLTKHQAAPTLPANEKRTARWRDGESCPACDEAARIGVALNAELQTYLRGRYPRQVSVDRFVNAMEIALKITEGSAP